jgi:hypothetical protein
MMDFFKTDVGKVALGGLIAVSGQLMATFIGWAKEYWFDASKRRREAEYLAIRLVLIFDELVTACYNAVHDPLQEDQEGCSESTVADPTLSLPTDGDYKALPRRLMFQIMSMPSKLDGIREGMANAYEFTGPPNFEEFFEYRREHWSKLGLEALELIDALCREYKIPAPDRPEYYEPKPSFLKEIADVQEVQRERQEASNKAMATFLASQSKAGGVSGS